MKNNIKRVNNESNSKINGDKILKPENSTNSKNSLNFEKNNQKTDKDKDINEEIIEGKNKFINIVDKLMDEIIKNNDKKFPIKQQNSNSILKNKYSDNGFQKFKERLKIKNVTLIQRNFRDFLKRKYHYEPPVYPTQKEIETKNKEDLKNDLIKYIKEIKKLIETLNRYKNKINYFELENKKLKNIIHSKKSYVIDSQKNINIISNMISINTKREGKELNENNLTKDNKTVLRKKPAKPSKKVTILNDFDDKPTENEKKEDAIKMENEVKLDPKEKQERLKKSRGLRKLLTKKEKEKKDTLKKYFRKFFINGLYLSIKKKSSNIKEEPPTKRSQSSFGKRGSIMKLNTLNNTFLFDLNNIEMNNNKEEVVDEKIKLLERIFYRKDRIHTLIAKQTFQKYNLRVKLISLKEAKKERISKFGSKPKNKKKLKNKAKSVAHFKQNEDNKNINVNINVIH